MPSSPDVVVMMSPGLPTSNPFTSLLIASLPERVRVTPFRWPAAFGTRYSVLHIHWPDAVLRGATVPRQVFKLVLLLVLIARSRLAGVKHVETVHNLRPHESEERPSMRARLEAATLRLWRNSCWRRVYMTDVGTDGDNRAVVIPHGDYRSIVPMFDSPERQINSFLLFGRLRPYKGIEEFLDAFHHAFKKDDASLTIAGSPLNSDFAATIRDSVRTLSNVSLRLDRLTDEDLMEELRRHEAVVLPYRTVYNSGAALLALSAGTPIIITASATTRELQQEYGEEWVALIPYPPTAAALTAAAGSLRSRERGAPPRSPRRDWRSIGASYGEIYSSAPRRGPSIRRARA